MDCIHARMLIVLQGRDAQELDADARTALDHHLEVCADCLAWTHQESRVDEALGQAIQAVPAPADLPSKILHQLEHQPRSHRAAWITAAAACLLLALSGGGYFWFTERPVITLSDFEALVAFQEISSPQGIEDYFADNNMTMKVPTVIAFENCNHYSIEIVKGRRLPRLEYIAREDGEGRGAVAHVYVVAEASFHIDDIVAAIARHAEPIVTSKHKIEALRDAENPGYVFVVVYTGGSLSPFMIARGI
jgi:hypothetical protein